MCLARAKGTGPGSWDGAGSMDEVGMEAAISAAISSGCTAPETAMVMGPRAKYSSWNVLSPSNVARLMSDTRPAMRRAAGCPWYASAKNSS